MKYLVLSKIFHLFCLKRLCQLTAVCVKPIFTLNETVTVEVFISMNLRRKCRLAELDQVLRQDDEMFENLLIEILVKFIRM